MNVIGLGVFAALFLGWAVITARPADDGQIAAMAKMYSIPLSPAVVDRLRARVTMLRRWRLVGAVLGVAGSGVVAAITTVEVSVGSLLFGVAIGYGVASIGAEMADVRQRGSRQPGGAIAMAKPRTLRSVVGPLAFAPAGLAALLGGIGIAVLVVAPPEPDAVSAGREPLAGFDLWLVGVGFVAVVAFGVMAVRQLALAPEQGSEPADHVVQRASRLVAIMTIVGATWMTVGVLGTIVWRSMWWAVTGAEPLNWIAAISGIYLGLSAPMGFISTVSSLPRNRPWTGPKAQLTPPRTSGGGVR